MVAGPVFTEAGDRTRTGDPQLGKPTAVNRGRSKPLYFLGFFVLSNRQQPFPGGSSVPTFVPRGRPIEPRPQQPETVGYGTDMGTRKAAPEGAARFPPIQRPSMLAALRYRLQFANVPDGSFLSRLTPSVFT